MPSPYQALNDASRLAHAELTGTSPKPNEQGWMALPSPELCGLFQTLKAQIRLYDVTGCNVYLASDGHGIDLNPDAPPVPGEGPLRGPFRTLLIVDLSVHCSVSGELAVLPFKLGHVDELRGDALRTWVRAALTKIMEHEVDEGICW